MGELLDAGVDVRWLMGDARIPQVLALGGAVMRARVRAAVNQAELTTLAIAASISKEGAQCQKKEHRRLLGE